MRYALIVLVFCLINISIKAQINPEIIWTFDTQSAAYGMAACEDLNDDGLPDIVFGCYRNDGHIYALDGQDGSLLWSFNATVPGTDQGCNDVAVLIYDIDGDGMNEVIVPSSCYARTFCFNGHDGSLRWAAVTRGSDSPPVIADLKGKGDKEILHGEFTGWVRSIDPKTGITNWDFQVQTNCWIQTAPSIVDIDKDGLPDFVVATWSFEAGKDHIYAFRGADQTLLWKKNISGLVYHGSAIGDLDGDGNEEMIIGSYNDTLYCLDVLTGETKWSYSIGQNFTPAGPVVIVDLDGDGQCEVLGSAWFKHFALNADGTLRWTYSDPQSGFSFRGPAVADLNGDDVPDLVFGTSLGIVRGLNGKNGQPLFQVDLRNEYGDNRFELDHCPLIADFDGDGALDIFIAGGYGVIPINENFGRAYMIRIGYGNGPEWRMFQHDIGRRSNVCSDFINLVPETPILEFGLYPNPATGKLFLDNIPSGIPYQIMNLLGYEMHSGIVDDSQTISIDPFPKGMYILSIFSNNQRVTKRFVKE